MGNKSFNIIEPIKTGINCNSSSNGNIYIGKNSSEVSFDDNGDIITASSNKKNTPSKGWNSTRIQGIVEVNKDDVYINDIKIASSKK